MRNAIVNLDIRTVCHALVCAKINVQLAKQVIQILKSIEIWYLTSVFVLLHMVPIHSATTENVLMHDQSINLMLKERV